MLSGKTKVPTFELSGQVELEVNVVELVLACIDLKRWVRRNSLQLQQSLPVLVSFDRMLYSNVFLQSLALTISAARWTESLCKKPKVFSAFWRIVQEGRNTTYLGNWPKERSMFTISTSCLSLSNTIKFSFQSMKLTTACENSGHKHTPKNSMAQTPTRIAVYNVPQKIVPNNNCWSINSHVS